MKTLLHATKKHWGIGSIILLFALLDVVAFFFYINIWMTTTYAHTIRVSSDDLPHTATAVIFGGGVEDDGSLGQMLHDRVVAGLSLYQDGIVDTILITGDDGMNREDEITPMYTFLVDRGVAAQDILVDRHGYRTYESCYRAAHVFGVQEMIAVSQTFHLYRIAYLCEAQGIATIGLPADTRVYTDVWTSGPREIGARVKAWWQGELTKPLPRVLN